MNLSYFFPYFFKIEGITTAYKVLQICNWNWTGTEIDILQYVVLNE